jgi:hypothetical protein
MDTTSEHSPCSNCRTVDPDTFDSPTAAFCRTCWARQTDYSRQFHEWADGVTRRSSRWPFFVGRSS